MGKWVWLLEGLSNFPSPIGEKALGKTMDWNTTGHPVILRRYFELCDAWTAHDWVKARFGGHTRYTSSGTDRFQIMNPFYTNRYKQHIFIYTYVYIYMYINIFTYIYPFSYLYLFKWSPMISQWASTKLMMSVAVAYPFGMRWRCP